jgi:hypothetical protein
LTDADTQAAEEEKVWAQGKAVWASAGDLVRGPITAALKAKNGTFLAGDKPGELDCESRVTLVLQLPPIANSY